MCSAMRKLLPSWLPNGQRFNAHAGFPGRPFDLQSDATIVRAYTSANGSDFYTVVIGAKAGANLVARCDADLVIFDMFGTQLQTTTVRSGATVPVPVGASIIRGTGR